MFARAGFPARASRIASRPSSKRAQVLARVLGSLPPSCPATRHSAACSAMPARAPARQCPSSGQSSSHGFQHTVPHSPCCCHWSGLSASTCQQLFPKALLTAAVCLPSPCLLAAVRLCGLLFACLGVSIRSYLWSQAAHQLDSLTCKSSHTRAMYIGYLQQGKGKSSVY